MGDRTGIEWTDATWNPTVGCSRVSEGCDHCYAETQSARQSHNPAYEGVLAPNAAGSLKWSGRLNQLAERLDQPLRWARPRRIFVNSMSDLFHDGVGFDFIARVFGVMACAPWHTFQILTKRPQRMEQMLSDIAFRDLVRDHAATTWSGMNRQARLLANGWGGPLGQWPLANVWLGTSIELDKYAFRARHLARTPAAVRWLSCEPLLGPLNQKTVLEFAGLDWIVVGGESGAGARPMHPQWVREIREACRTLGVPFLFKQWGAWEPVRPVYIDDICMDPLDDLDRVPLVGLEVTGAIACRIAADGSHVGQQPAPGADPHWMALVGKKIAGRLLDGRTWDEYPRPRLEPVG